ncbi:Methyl-CpG-binding domain protein 2 [Taenia crassiceps]|uniref:Methyl-CpG-binding domain protein 2 n=1 Tax=Taenia crassiceps TaxID=6207 RepID=A0ABR4QIR0_9CEST
MAYLGYGWQLIRKCKTEDVEYDWFQRNTTPNFPKPVIVLNHADSNRSDKSPIKESLKQSVVCPIVMLLTTVMGKRSCVPPYHRGLNHGPITGQERTVEQNPCAMLNQNQPYVKNFVITDEDIRKQYQRVKDIRDRLQAARRV